MATAHLLIPSDDGKKVLANGVRLPTLPTGDLFRAGELLGLDVAVTRTIGRHGDDRVVLCELLSDRPPAGATWIEATRLADQALVNATVQAWRDGHARDDLLPWEREGWFRDVVAWIDDSLAKRDRVRVGRPVQLRHWGLSAVLKIPTDEGSVVVKQVPAGLGAEGRATRWLGDVRPEAVPAVHIVDDQRSRFLMEGIDAPTPPDVHDFLTLVALQHAASTRGEELERLGLPDRRPLALVNAVRQLAGRDDLLFERGWSLAVTDTRRPPRPVTIDDVAALHRLVDEVEPIARRLEADMPSGTIVHGDFHQGNVLRAGGRVVVIDWGLAALGHPLFDVPAWPSWDEPSNATLEPYLEAWRCTSAEWRLVGPLAHLFHATTAADVADSMPSAPRRTDWAAAVQKCVLRSLAN
jgi:hypothetical protein